MITKIILRTLMSPFLLCMILIKYNYTAIIHWLLAVRYGGEWVNYDNETKKPSK